MNIKYSPPLLEYFPEARELICDWATEQIQKETLTCENLADHIKTELIPTIYEYHTNKCRENTLTCLDFEQFKR